MRKQSGQVIVIVIAIVAVFLILIPLSVYMLRQESKWTIKEKQSTVAFHLTEAALDRAIWKLNERIDGWERIINGTIPAGHDGTREYTDIPSTGTASAGKYKIKITSGQYADEKAVIVQAIAIDKSGKEVRGLKAIYRRSYVDAAIHVAGKVKIKGAYDIHWGPITTQYDNIELEGEAVNDFFPRKFAGPGCLVLGGALRDTVIGAPTEGPPTRLDGSAWVDSLYKEWHSEFDVSDPEINLNAYIPLAKAYTTPLSAPNRDKADPDGSGYYPLSTGKGKGSDGIDKVKFGKGFEDSCSTATYFIEGDCDFGGNVTIAPDDLTDPDNLKTAVVVIGNVKIGGGSKKSSFTVAVPENAWKEYQYFDTILPDEYPADDGYMDSADTHLFYTSKRKDYESKHWSKKGDIMLAGFLYVGGNLEYHGEHMIYGVMVIEGETTKGGLSGHGQLYYSRGVDENIQYTSSGWKRKYWAEFNPGSFDNPTW